MSLEGGSRPVHLSISGDSEGRGVTAALGLRRGGASRKGPGAAGQPDPPGQDLRREDLRESHPERAAPRGLRV